MPDKLENHIHAISLKLQQLLKSYATQLRQVETLRKENEQLNAANEEMSAEIYQLKEQILILKSAAISMGEKDKKAFEKNINQYIRTLDKCMAILKV